MINWSSLISRNQGSVKKFAVGNLSATEFQHDFAGKNNPARSLVREHGATYGRRLARKALRRRGLLK